MTSKEMNAMVILSCSAPPSAVGHQTAILAEGETIQGNCAVSRELVGVQEHFGVPLQVCLCVDHILRLQP